MATQKLMPDNPTADLDFYFGSTPAAAPAGTLIDNRSGLETVNVTASRLGGVPHWVWIAAGAALLYMAVRD